MSEHPAAHLVERRLVATVDGVEVVVDGGPEHLAEWRSRAHVQAVRLESRRVTPWQRDADDTGPGGAPSADPSAAFVPRLLRCLRERRDRSHRPPMYRVGSIEGRRSALPGDHTPEEAEQIIRTFADACLSHARALRAAEFAPSITGDSASEAGLW